MVAFEHDVDERPDRQMMLQNESLKQIRRVLRTCGGKELEKELFLFANSGDAMMAALHIRDQLEKYTKNAGQQAACTQISGYGIHEGHIIYIPTTDVHWGDPVNTASKLGQDCATGGELIISDSAYEAIVKDPRSTGLFFTKQQLSQSKVKFDCYKVVRNADLSMTHRSDQIGSRMNCDTWLGHHGTRCTNQHHGGHVAR